MEHFAAFGPVGEPDLADEAGSTQAAVPLNLGAFSKGHSGRTRGTRRERRFESFSPYKPRSVWPAYRRRSPSGIPSSRPPNSSRSFPFRTTANYRFLVPFDLYLQPKYPYTHRLGHDFISQMPNQGVKFPKISTINQYSCWVLLTSTAISSSKPSLSNTYRGSFL